MKIAIIDSGASNLNSVYQALLRLESKPQVVISADKAELASADKLIFPGVGAISAVMDGLKARDLADFVKNTQKPMLGICLGMQIMFERSTEVPLESTEPYFKGLGILPGTVDKIHCGALPLPHMGWNSLDFADHPLFEKVPKGAFVYFVHSYCAPLGDFTLASAEYGQQFSAAVIKDNFIGVQFHPEKSGPIGALILKNFVERL